MRVIIVESASAGGHNSPPRGVRRLDATGQPVYGGKDSVDLGKIRDLGLPFWLAGGEASPDRLEAAIEAGAAGAETGTAFALCEESGLDPRLRHALLRNALEGRASVFTDALASPTGFPFKVAALEGSLSEQSVYEARERTCDLGYLREACRRENGTIGYRCPGEPVAAYVAKGGDAAAAIGRKCLCNALLANIGMAQIRGNGLEPPLVTAGDDLSGVRRFLQPGETSYTARAVIDTMLSPDRKKVPGIPPSLSLRS